MLPACYIFTHILIQKHITHTHTLTFTTHYRDRTRYAQHTTNLLPLEKYHQLVRVTIKQNNTRDNVHQYIPWLLLSPPY